MSRYELRQKVSEFICLILANQDWDAETDDPKMLEIELDSTVKVVVLLEDDNTTIKIHRK